MIESARHVPLRPAPWDARIVAVAIDEIVSDALTHFDEIGERPDHSLRRWLEAYARDHAVAL